MKTYSHLFFPREDSASALQCRSSLGFKNKKGLFWLSLIPYFILLALIGAILILGLVYFNRIKEALTGINIGKYILWASIGIFVIAFKEPIIMLLKVLIKKIG